MASTERTCRRLFAKQVRAYWKTAIRDILAGLQRPNLPHGFVTRGMYADEFHPKPSSLM